MSKTRFVIMLENYEKNKDKIEKGPYVRQMDLAITCHQLILLESEEMCTCRVTWDLLELWDLSPEELFKVAGNDSREWLPPTIEPMEDVIIGFMAEDILNSRDLELEEALEEAENEYLSLFGVPKERIPEIYVVTNSLRIQGAAVIFYSDILKQFAEKKECDLILLPSSIHEWLIIPEDCSISMEDMKSMVYDANRLVVHEEEVLSDGVYRYSRKNDKIEFVGKIEG